MATSKKTRPRKRSTKRKSTAETLAAINKGLEGFNSASAMNFDGPGQWQDWVVHAVSSTSEEHTIQLRAGEERLTRTVPAFVDLESGQLISALVEFICGGSPTFFESERLSGSLERTAAAIEANLVRYEPGELARFQAENSRHIATQGATFHGFSRFPGPRPPRVPPTATEVRQALAQHDTAKLQSLVEDALESPMLGEAVDLLFNANKKPEFIAEVFRLIIRVPALKLTRRQWELIASADTSNVVREVALKRSVEG